MIPNLIVSVAGVPKSGKSHLALTFPEPVVIFSFDIGIEPVLKHFPDKQIKVVTYPVPIVDSVKALGMQKELRGIWDTFVSDYRKQTENKDVQTLVIDTATAVYEIARVARAAELGQENLLQFQYGDVYARMKSLIQRPRIAGQNLVLTHYLRDRYVNDMNTGEKELDGWRHTEGEVDIVLRVRKEVRKLPKGERAVFFVATLTDNRYDPTADGTEFEYRAGEPSNFYEDLAAVLGVAE